MGGKIAKQGNTFAGTAMAPRLWIFAHENMDKHYFEGFEGVRKEEPCVYGGNQMYEQLSSNTFFTALVLKNSRLLPLSAGFTFHADAMILRTTSLR